MGHEQNQKVIKITLRRVNVYKKDLSTGVVYLTCVFLFPNFMLLTCFKKQQTNIYVNYLKLNLFIYSYFQQYFIEQISLICDL